MKKAVLLLTVMCLLSFSFAAGQQGTQEKKADAQENLSIVTEVKPVPENVKVGFDSINGKDAVIYLSFISSDLLQGRDTASPGFDIAAEYAASLFKKWGIKPAGDLVRSFGRRMFAAPARQQKPKRSYFQNIPFREILGNEGTIQVAWQKGVQKKSRSFDPDMDYVFRASESQTFSAPVVFVGYGIQEPSLKLDEYKGLDVKGKIVLMLSETPGKDDPNSPFNKGKLKEKYYPARRMMRRRTSPKTQLAGKLGAAAVVMIDNSPGENGDIFRSILASRRINDERPIIPGRRRRLSLMEGGRMSMTGTRIPTIRVSRQMADVILGYAGRNVDSLKADIGKDLKSHSMALPGVTMTVRNTTKSKLVSSHNVLGYIEGSDPELKKEVLVIGAHLDHLGMRGPYIFNGADDNGSGSVGVLEVAEAFAKNPVKPKRTILFALWTGEEKGLLGSRYYMSHPYFPLKNTVTDLNMDMISRVWSADRLKMMSGRMGINVSKELMEKIDAKKFLSLSLDAKSKALQEALKANNQYVGLHMILRPSERASGGSDFAPFAQKKIPWVAFMAAMTEDYHQPSDSVGKVSSKMMQRVMRLVYLTANTMANGSSH